LEFAGELPARALEVLDVEREVIERGPAGAFRTGAARQDQEHARELDEQQRRVARWFAAEQVDPDPSLGVDVLNHQVVVAHGHADLVEREHLRLRLRREGDTHGASETREPFHECSLPRAPSAGPT
jgi:hypothetical protein